MKSQYLIDNIDDPKIQYFIISGYQAYTDLCKIYGLDLFPYLTFISKIKAGKKEVDFFYKFLDACQANPFNK